MQKSKNKLITMLEDVFREENIETKKDNLQDKHGLRMNVELERKLSDMCNLSEVVLERGEKQAAIRIATNMFVKGASFEEVCAVIDNLTKEELEEIYQNL